VAGEGKEKKGRKRRGKNTGEKKMGR